MKCICISCFDHYSTRMKLINKFFQQKGYEVIYLYANYDHFAKQSNEKKYVNGMAIPVMPYKRNLSVSRLASHYQFSKRILKEIEKIKPHVIYCMIPPNSLTKDIAIYKRNNKVKLVFDCYDMWPESFPYGKWNKLLSIPFTAWGNLRKKYISEADLVVAVSEYQKNLLKQEVIYTPIEILKPAITEGEIPTFNSNISEEISFCYLGMVNHITDIELGVKLLSGLRKYKNVTLHIIGEGQNLKEFVNSLEEANVKVVCHGVIFDIDKKNEIFSLCNFGLNIPRLEIKSSMSLKSIEYMRVGLPFINSGIGDTKQIVKHENVGIDICRENIFQTIDTILNLSNDELIAMHDNCRAYYEENMKIQNLENIFKDVV